MTSRAWCLGAFLFLAASCSSSTMQPDEAEPTLTTSATTTVAPAASTGGALPADEASVARKWLERLASGTASYTADFQCGICAIGGLFSITEQHGVLVDVVDLEANPTPDGEPWTLSKALTDALASGGRPSVTEYSDMAVFVYVDIDPSSDDDAEYTYRADLIDVTPDGPSSPDGTEPAPAPDGTQFIFPLVTGTLQGPNSDVAGWAASLRDQAPEAATVPVIVPAALAAGESLRLDINRITANPVQSRAELRQPAGSTVITSFGHEPACESSGAMPWLATPVRTDLVGCIADLGAQPGLNRIANWSEAGRTWTAESELATTDAVLKLLTTLTLVPTT